MLNSLLLTTKFNKKIINLIFKHSLSMTLIEKIKIEMAHSFQFRAKTCLTMNEILTKKKYNKFVNFPILKNEKIECITQKKLILENKIYYLKVRKKKILYKFRQIKYFTKNGRKKCRKKYFSMLGKKHSKYSKRKISTSLINRK
jgi:hypothetical protein